MKIGELKSLLRSRLMTRGIPAKAHSLKDGSFFVSVIISGNSLSIEVPYTIREDNGSIKVNSDNESFEVDKLTSAVAVMAKDIRSQRTTLSKFTKGGA